MSRNPVLARAVAGAVSSLVVAGLLATPAVAATTDTARVTAGAQRPDDAAYALTVVSTSASAVFLPAPAPAPTVTLARSGAPTDTLTGSGVSAPDPSTVTGTVDYTRANPGDYDVTVTQGSTTISCHSCVEVVAPAPGVTAVSPAVLGSGTTGGGYQPFVVQGTGFTVGPYTQCTAAAATSCPGGTVGVFGADGNADPNVTLGATRTSSGAAAPTATTAGTITLRAAVTGGVAAPYADDVVVTNTDGQRATCAGCLAIDPQPTVTALAGPGTGVTGSGPIGQGATGQTLTVSGAHFAPDASVAFTGPTTSSGTIAHGAPTVSADGTTLTLPGVDTTGVTTPGAWTLTVSNPDAHSSSAAYGFTVDAAPSATGITTPDSTTGAYGAGAKAVRVVVSADAAAPFVGGTDPAAHTSVAFPGLPAGVQVTGETADAAAHTVTATLDIPAGTAPGSYPVVLVNPDAGRSAPCDDAATPLSANTCVLTIAAGPTVTSLSPSTATGGFTGDVTVTGAGFHTTGVSVRLGTPDATYFDGPATVVDAHTLTLNGVTVPQDATVTDADITVVNSDDAGRVTAPGVFHVANLSVTDVTTTGGQHSALNSGPRDLVVTGTHLDPAATVTLTRRVGATLVSLPVTSVRSVDAQTLDVTVDLTGADPGTYDVSVTNPATSDHPGTATCAQCFTVVAPAPTISSVAPSALGGGASEVPVVVTGTGFYPHSALTFDDADVHPVGAPTVDGDTITQLVSVAQDAKDALGTVTVTNTDGQSASTAFTVDSAPTVDHVDWTRRAAGSDAFPVTVTGAGFDTTAPPSLAFDNPGVSATDVSTDGTGTTLTALVTVAADALSGHDPVSLTVVNPDQGRATGSDTLTVDPQPTVTGVDPAAVAAGSTPTLRLSGTAFTPGVTFTAPDGSGLGFGTPTVVDDSDVTVPVTVDATAARGTRVVTVTQPDNGGETTFALPVFVVPGTPADVRASGGVGSIDVTWSAPDDGGDPAGITSYTLTVAPHGDPGAARTVVTPGTATEDVVDGLAEGTAYDVTVAAGNTAGSSAPSAAVTATTLARPGAVTALAATAGDGRVTARWSPPATDGGSPVTGYVVTVTPGSFTTNLPATADHVTVTGLVNGRTYAVSVAARNAAGTGPAGAVSGLRPRYRTHLGIASSATSVASGHRVTLHGRLVRVATGAAIRGATVQVYRAAPGGVLRRVATVRTDSTGRWRFVAQPRRTVRFQVRFAGDGADAAARSAIVTITVG